MEDTQIISLYFSRDEDAIRQTDLKYGTTLRSQSRRIVRSREDAEECVNDAYLKTWNAIPPARPDSLQAFLSRIVRNLSLDRLRAANAQKRDAVLMPLTDELDECFGSDPYEEAMAQEEMTEHLNAFLGTLDERDRYAFLRRYFYGESVTRIAWKLKITPSHVSTILSRARKKLKEELEKGGRRG